MNRYPVQWRDKELFLSDLTRGVKKAFCEWVVKRLRADAAADYAGYPAREAAYLDGLRARVWWSGPKMSPAVWEWLYKSIEGGREYTRLLFGESAKGLSDDELEQLIDEKEADPASDYMLALAAVHEDADPKASGPASGSGATPTPSTAPS